MCGGKGWCQCICGCGVLVCVLCIVWVLCGGGGCQYNVCVCVCVCVCVQKGGQSARQSLRCQAALSDSRWPFTCHIASTPRHHSHHTESEGGREREGGGRERERERETRGLYKLLNSYEHCTLTRGNCQRKPRTNVPLERTPPPPPTPTPSPPQWGRSKISPAKNPALVRVPATRLWVG